MMTTEMMAIPNSDDANLVAQSLTGNREAFGKIVARYQSLVCSLAYSSTGSLSQSEDLAQETFLAAWRHLSDLREADKLRAWLCRIARNLICDALREQGREPTHAGESLDSVPESPAPEPWPSEHAISEEEKTILWRSIERIPQLYREPLVLFYREHRSIESVAADLGLSQDAVKQRLSRGRKLLHEQVLAFVEGALEHTNPGRLFTIGVMAALPAFAATATATAAGAAAVKSGTTAKAATAAGTLGALLSWGVFCFFSVLGFMAFCGGCLGYAMGRAARRSARQRLHLIQFWRALAAGFGVLVLPVLVASEMAPRAGWSPAIWHGMTLWLGLMYPLLAVSLVICIFQWWRDLPPSESDGAELEKASKKRLVTWVALATAVPAFLLAESLFGIFFQSTWQSEGITASQAETIIRDRRDARFSVSEYRDGSRTLWIKLPENDRRIILRTPANEQILSLLAQRNVAHETEIEDRQLGKPVKLLLLLSAFFLTPAGAIVLLLQMNTGTGSSSPRAAARTFAPSQSRFDRTLLALRTEPALRTTLAVGFAIVFLLVLGASAFLAWVPSDWYVSTVRVKVEAASPQSLPAELAIIQSDAILSLVAENLDLSRKWAKYNHGQTLANSETVSLLRRFMELHVLTNSQIAIAVSDTDRAAAADVANRIAEAYCDQRNRDTQAVELVARAVPARAPIQPNRRWIILLTGTLAGALFGIVIGVGATCLRAWHSC